MNKNNDLILHFFNRLLNKSRGSREILALLSGCAFPLAFAPFNLWPVAILVIMMLMLSLEGASRREGVLRFYLFGIGMYGVGNWWIYHSIHVYGGASPVLAFSMMTLLVLAYALHAALHGYIYMRFFHDRRWAVPVVFPVLWVLQEWVRTWLLTGFPWFFAGYTQMDTPLAGYAPVLGVMGVSLMLLVAISFLYSLLAGKTSVRWAAAVFLIVWLAGALLQQLPFVTPTAEKLSVSLLQGNVDQRTKWRRESVVPILKLYREMTRDELGRDIIVWPEASITLLRENAGRYLDEMDALASENGSTIILGLPDRDPVSHRFYNTAMALGKGEGNYFKRRLVPFGEYVPLESLLR
ncbi:MAG: apolipoprotein N-acyltransferase, partial [Gammaproteobacteria bacterium]|nr:apolipoprotein N-acyltransferase [Gammaproteobacteria bacterium]